MNFFTAPRRVVICIVLLFIFGINLWFDGFRLDTALVLLIFILTLWLTLLQIYRPERFPKKDTKNQDNTTLFWVSAGGFSVYSILQVYFWGM